MVFILYKPYFLSPYTNSKPKSTLHLNLPILKKQNKKKQNSVLFISFWTHGDLNLGPHHDMSPHESVHI